MVVAPVLGLQRARVGQEELAGLEEQTRLCAQAGGMDRASATTREALSALAMTAILR